MPGRSAAAMPSPVSLTTSRARPRHGDASTVTEPPAGVCRNAFSTRLSRTRSTSPMSATTRSGAAAGAAPTSDWRRTPRRVIGKLLQDVVRQLGDRKLLAFCARVAGLEPRQLEQIGDETAEALALASRG